jgi:spore maturation protein CgeB
MEQKKFWEAVFEEMANILLSGKCEEMDKLSELNEYDVNESSAFLDLSQIFLKNIGEKALERVIARYEIEVQKKLCEGMNMIIAKCACRE